MVALRSEFRNSSSVIVFAFHELVQDLVVDFGDRLDQLRVECFRFLLQVGRDPSVTYSAPRVSSRQTMAFMLTRSMTPLNLSSWPIGIWIATGLGIQAVEDGVHGVLEIRAHPSILLMKQIRGTSYLSACRHTVSDCGCTPCDGVEHRDRAIEHAQRCAPLPP